METEMGREWEWGLEKEKEKRVLGKGKEGSPSENQRLIGDKSR